MKTIIEPFRIKMTEPVKMTTHEEREAALTKAHNNVFLLDAEDCCIDLLTDSGTGAMSSAQWSALMLGDESYAGSRSWKKFESAVRDITGFKHILPTHQGRAAENILATCVVRPGHVIPNNTHFDTTRANMEYAGALAQDLPSKKALDTALEAPFKGDMDLDKLDACIAHHGAEKIPFCIMTVTNNTGGGQPVSLENIRAAKDLLSRHGIPLIIDCCRFAENAYFIRQMEDGYAERSLTDIAREMFSYTDGAVMSCKKDGMANIGGFLAINDDTWAEQFKNILILREGFPTYGGLAGRDLEVIAVGLREALELDYQRYRHASVDYLGKRFIERGIPIVRPVGGHAVFIDAAKFVSHVPHDRYPGIGLVNTLYLEGGVRAVEIGTVMFGRYDEQGNQLPAPLELVRLALPRRVYTQSHFDYLIEVVDEVWNRRLEIPGYRITYQPRFLRHFSCHYERMA